MRHTPHTRWLLASLALTLLSACGADVTKVPRTEVLVSIDGGPGVRMRADKLRVKLWGGSDDADALEPAGEDVFNVSKSFTWPATLALVPKAGDAQRNFSLLVTAEEKGRKLTEARVRTRFVAKQTLLLELVLDDACIGYFACSEDQTCQASHGKPQCVSAHVDSNKLPSFDGKPRSPAQGEPFDSGTGDARASLADAGDTVDAQTTADAATSHDASVSCASAEDCTNGDDDDCDGLGDCADSDCAAVTQCVPSATALGVLVDANASCPAGYTHRELLLNADLIGGTCEGCKCGNAGATTCTAQLLTYGSSADCTIGNVQDTFDVSTFACVQNPITTHGYSGWGVGAIVATPGNCPPSGTAKPHKPSWGTSRKLCVADAQQDGCDSGSVCVPKPQSGNVCRQVALDAACATGPVDTWYQGYSDTRSCGDCDCTPQGASCSNVQLKLGSDYACNAGPSALSAGQKDCSAFPYSPPASLVGSPTNASCKPDAPLSGTLTPTKPVGLCCAP